MSAAATTRATIRIVGAQAADIARHVTTYVHPGRNWSEVQGMRECHHGCCLYVRNHGGRYEYRLMHNTNYGCALARSADTRDVLVSVAPLATA